MGRLVCPGESFSSAQIREVAEAVAERGGESVDVTTRGDMLLQLPDADLSALQTALMQEGLTQGAPTQGTCSESQAVSGPPTGAGRWVPRNEDLTGVHERQPGLFSIGVPLAAGRISAQQLAKAADVAERHGDGRVRFTARQGLLLLGVPQEKVLHALEGLEGVGLKPQGSMVRRGLVVCSETELCVEDWSALSRRAREIVDHLEKQLLLSDPLRIRLTGPSCTCGAPAEEEISIAGVKLELGQEPGAGSDPFDVRVGGRLLAGAVRGDEVKFLLEHLLVSWKRQRKPAESLGEFCGRIGYEQVAQQLRKEVAG